LASVAIALGASCSQPADDRAPDPPAVNPPPPPEQPAAFSPVPATMRRLLSRQYKNAVRTLFGTEAAAAAAPPEDASVDGFDAIAARKNALSDSAVSAYEKSARAVAAAAMKNKARIDKLAGCSPKSSVDAACHASFVARLGRLAFRRPLSDAEVTRYTALAKDISADAGDFFVGVEATISAFLQSPRFLYMQEVGVPLPGKEGEHGKRRKLTDQELLTRMSFFLLDTTPDETLLDLVEAEGLDTEEQIRFVASIMLERLEARAALSGFFAELYRTRELDALGKDATLYPSFSPSLARSMREGMLHVIEDVVWERDADVREIFTADYTFVNKELAALYGVAAPSGDAFGKVLLPKSEQRDGLLGQPGILARFAHAATTSPTLRGKFVREKLLCQTIPPPPPDVLTTLPDDDPTQAPKTMKEKLSQHQNDPACSGCHKLMDGIGFAFERFDSIGRFRTEDQGVEIDPTTSTEGLGAFASPAELGAILGESPEVADCLVRNVYRNALGHLETKGELEELSAISATFAAKGFRMRDLLVDLVSSRAFRIVGVPE
jgi:hypothetical protein